jgi:4-amino-4-deoxy-L-arabinose transferase-like glycosyltransferase
LSPARAVASPQSIDNLTARTDVGAISLIDAVLVRLVRHYPAPLLLVPLLAVVALVNIVTLLRSPAPFVDEAWYAARAWGLIQTGRNVGALDLGVVEHYPGYWTFFPLIGTWIQAVGIHVFGMSLFSVRLTSLAFGLILLGAVYVIGSHLDGVFTGLLAATFVSVSRLFLYSAHLAREDVMVAAFGFGGIALYLVDDARRWPIRSFLAGLAIGIAFEIHPNGMLYGPVIAALFFWDYGWSALRVRRFWGFIAGGCAGLVMYAILHILPYPSTYLALNALMFGTSHNPPFLTLNPAVWIASIASIRAALENRVDLGLVLVGLLLILITGRRRSDFRLLVLVVALCVMFGLVVLNRPDYYWILVTPTIGLLMATSLRRLCAILRTVSWSPIGLWAAQAILVAGAVGYIALHSVVPLFREDADSEFESALTMIQQSAPPGSVILGPQTYWFGVIDHPYLSWEALTYYPRYAPGSTLRDSLRALHPDVIIIDQHLDHFITDDSQQRAFDPGDYERHLQLPKAEFEAFLQQQATLVAVLDTTEYGRVRLYTVHWSLS